MRQTNWGTYWPSSSDGSIDKQYKNYYQQIGAYESLLEMLADVYADCDYYFEAWVLEEYNPTYNRDALREEWEESVADFLTKQKQTALNLTLTQRLFDDTIEEWANKFDSLYDHHHEDIVDELKYYFNLKLK